jgi:hypothetical protein
MATRLLTINIRDYLIKTPRRKRHMRISNYIRLRIAKSTNVPVDNIRISQDLNALILTKYLKSMKKLKVNISVEKDRALVTAFSDKPAPKPATDAKSQTGVAAPAAKPSASGAPSTPIVKTSAPAAKKEGAVKTETKEVKK